MLAAVVLLWPRLTFPGIGLRRPEPGSLRPFLLVLVIVVVVSSLLNLAFGGSRALIEALVFQLTAPSLEEELL